MNSNTDLATLWTSDTAGTNRITSKGINRLEMCIRSVIWWQSTSRATLIQAV